MKEGLAFAAGALVLAMAALAFIWRPADQAADAIISANGVLDLHSPWSEAAEHPRESRWTMNDPAMQMQPWREFMRAELEAGRLPFWNHLNGLGQPFLANPQARVLYPPQWLILLGDDVNSGQQVFLFLHILLGGLGLMLLAVRLGASVPAALFAGLSFALLGFNAIWLLWPQHATLAWLPLLLLTIDRLLERGRLGRFVGLATVMAMMLLAGHPETAFKCGVGAWLFATGRLLVRRRELGSGGVASVVAVWRVSAALVVGLLLAAPQLLPFLDYLRSSESLLARSAAPAFPPHAELVDFARGVAVFGGHLLSPDLMGDGAGPGRWWFTEGNYSEVASTYPGILVVLLAPFGLRAPGGWRWSIVFMLGFALLVVLRCPGFYPALIELPGFDVGANNRFIALASMAASLAAGLGLDRLLRADFSVFRAASSALVLLFALCFFGVSVLIATRTWPATTSEQEAIQSGVYLRDGLLLAAASTALVLVRWGRRLRPLGLVGLVAVLAVDIQVHARDRLPWCSRAELWPASPLLAFLEPIARPELGRVVAVERGFGDLESEAAQRRKHFPAETNIHYDIASLDSYDALLPADVARYSALAGLPLSGNGKLPLAWSSPAVFDDRLLDLASVRWLLIPGDWTAQAGLPPGTEIRSADGRVHRQLYAGADGLVLERPSAMPRAFLVFEARKGGLEDLLAADFDPRSEALIAEGEPFSEEGSGRVEIRRLRADRMELEVEIEAGRPLLVTSDLMTDLWIAEVDGEARTIEGCDGIFRGLRLEPGRHRVVFMTRAAWPPFLWGWAATGLVLLGFALSYLRGSLRRRRSTS